MSGATADLPDPAATMEIQAAAVAEWISRPAADRPRLVDCREADELAICKIDGHEWVPLGDFPKALAGLTTDSARGVVIYCHHGMRSLRAAGFLRSQGFENAFSLAGGIDAWSRTVDEDVPRY